MNRRKAVLQRLRNLQRPPRYHNNEPGSGLATLAELADLLRRDMPFCHIRYGDGTFHCIRGTRQQNSDGVLLHPELGAELLQVLRETAHRSITDRCIFVGGIWDDPTNDFLIANNLRWSVPWCSANAFYDGLAGLQSLEFIKLLAASGQPKVLVGPEHIAPAARFLGAEHVVVPATAAWENSAAILPHVLAASRKPHTLAIFAAGMVSDTWGWRVYRESITSSVIDIGHTFDACLGRKNRRYMQDSYRDHTLRDIVLREYAPLFDGFR